MARGKKTGHAMCPICKIRPKTSQHRGRCQACYVAVRRRVVSGETTWEAAESDGLVEARRYRQSAVAKYIAGKHRTG
jgi:hypothetical protein